VAAWLLVLALFLTAVVVLAGILGLITWAALSVLA
jgi:hypothetical protein